MPKAFQEKNTLAYFSGLPMTFEKLMYHRHYFISLSFPIGTIKLERLSLARLFMASSVTA
jgi:hypothetical protein